MDIDLPVNLNSVVEAAAEFAFYPGPQTDFSAKDFLDRFPLPVLFSVLQFNIGVPKVEEAVVECLERIFKTKYGASLIPNYASFIQSGLLGDSQKIRCLACKAVSNMLENTQFDVKTKQIIVEYDIYHLLVDCLVDGDEQTSAAAFDAIKNIAQSSEGLSIIFPNGGKESTLLKDVAARSSSLGRVRILALITKLFSLSTSVASTVYQANLLSLFEIEINDAKDTLSTLNALELVYELVESSHSAQFVSKTTLLQLLTDMINNSSTDSIVRSRAMLIGGRLLSSSYAYTVIDKSRIQELISVVNARLMVQNQDNDEHEISIETLGLIGTTSHGASLLILSSASAARHVIDGAFGRHGIGKQLAALYALGSICGADRTEGFVLLNGSEEECLKGLIYEYAASTSKLTPSGLLLSVLQQDPDIRLAGYRLISCLVVRRWCLVEVCSKPEIVVFVTDATVETTKRGMEARHSCCVAINAALSTSGMAGEPPGAEIAVKLQEAVRNGPYAAIRRGTPDVQPIVMTAERF